MARLRPGLQLWWREKTERCNYFSVSLAAGSFRNMMSFIRAEGSAMPKQERSARTILAVGASA